jgi:hypothetical protein
MPGKTWAGPWPPHRPGPGVPGTKTQPGWGGILYTATSAPVTSVTATFTVPSLSGETGAVASIWVGIGDVMQTGIYCSYDEGQPGNYSNLWPWTWWISGNGAAELWDASAFPVAAGDSMTCSLSVGATTWTATLANATEGWSYANVRAIQAVNVAISDWPFPLNAAGVIIEKEGTHPLPDYGTLTFTDIVTTPAIVAEDVTYITTVNTDTDQTPGTYSAGSFTMTWHNYS